MYLVQIHGFCYALELYAILLVSVQLIDYFTIYYFFNILNQTINYSSILPKKRCLKLVQINLLNVQYQNLIVCSIKQNKLSINHNHYSVLCPFSLLCLYLLRLHHS